MVFKSDLLSSNTPSIFLSKELYLYSISDINSFSLFSAFSYTLFIACSKASLPFSTLCIISSISSFILLMLSFFSFKRVSNEPAAWLSSLLSISTISFLLSSLNLIFSSTAWVILSLNSSKEFSILLINALCFFSLSSTWFTTASMLSVIAFILVCS